MKLNPLFYPTGVKKPFQVKRRKYLIFTGQSSGNIFGIKFKWYYCFVNVWKSSRANKSFFFQDSEFKKSEILRKKNKKTLLALMLICVNVIIIVGNKGGTFVGLMGRSVSSAGKHTNTNEYNFKNSFQNIIAALLIKNIKLLIHIEQL